MPEENPLADGMHLTMRYFKDGQTWTRVTYVPANEVLLDDLMCLRAEMMRRQLIEAAHGSA